MIYKYFLIWQNYKLNLRKVDSKNKGVCGAKIYIISKTNKRGKILQFM